MRMLQYLTVLFLFTCIPAWAGFQGFNGNTDLKLFNQLQCSTGLSCSKQKDKFQITTNGSVQTIAAAKAAGTLTQADCGTVIMNGAATEYDLPDASTVIGCVYTFIVGHVSNLTVDPATGDTILLLTNASGDSLVADAIGEVLTIQAVGDNSWAPLGSTGTWTDSN